MARAYANSRSAVLVSILSVLGPLFGLMLEIVLAWRFGASGTMDAYRIATLALVVGSQIFLGGLLAHVVVPLLAECRAKGEVTEGWRLAVSLAAVAGLVSLLPVGWVWLEPAVSVGLLGPGLSESARADAELLLRYFCLAFPLMAWSGVAGAVLYVYRVFWLSAAGQLLPNLFMIAVLAMAGGAASAGELALGMVLGYVAMAGALTLALIRICRSEEIPLADCLRPASGKGLAKALSLSLPLLATIIVGQWGMVIVNRAMSELPTGTLAELGYAWKLMGLVGLVPAGLATVIFPSFSAAHAKEDAAEFSRLVARALRMTLFLVVPLCAVLYVDRFLVVSLMFGRGGMTAAAQFETGELFGMLLAGAPAGVLSAALGKVAFSMHDTKTPAFVALLSAVAITVLIPPCTASGIPGDAVWAINAITWGGALLQLGHLAVIRRVVTMAEMLRYAVVLVALSAGIGLPVMALRFLFEANGMSGFAGDLLEIVLVGVVSIALGYMLARVLRIREAEEIARYFLWQLGQMPVVSKSVKSR